MSDCSACGAHLETPLGCDACGVVLDPGEEPGPFVVFGLEPTWEVDETDLKRRLRRIGRVVHPDFHAGVPEQRAMAERNSACLNRAFEVLLDPFLRADWIVQRLGGPTEQEERQMLATALAEQRRGLEEELRSSKQSTENEQQELRHAQEERHKRELERLSEEVAAERQDQHVLPESELAQLLLLLRHELPLPPFEAAAGRRLCA